MDGTKVTFIPDGVYLRKNCTPQCGQSPHERFCCIRFTSLLFWKAQVLIFSYLFARSISNRFQLTWIGAITLTILGDGNACGLWTRSPTIGIKVSSLPFIEQCSWFFTYPTCISITLFQSVSRSTMSTSTVLSFPLRTLKNPILHVTISVTMVTMISAIRYGFGQDAHLIEISKSKSPFRSIRRRQITRKLPRFVIVLVRMLLPFTMIGWAIKKMKYHP